MSWVSCWNSPSASTSPPNAITNVAPPQRWMYGVAARNHFTNASVLGAFFGMAADSNAYGLSGTKVAPQRVNGRERRERRRFRAQHARPERHRFAPAQQGHLDLPLREPALGPDQELERHARRGPGGHRG